MVLADFRNFAAKTAPKRGIEKSGPERVEPKIGTENKIGTEKRMPMESDPRKDQCQKAGIPIKVIDLVEQFVLERGLVKDQVFVELFAGSGNLTKAFRELGAASLRYDKKYNSTLHDFLSKLGYAWATYQSLRVMKYGHGHGGMRCALWVWISSSVHKRTNENIFGDTSRKDVRDANQTAQQMACLLKLWKMRGLTFSLEQPSSSRFYDYPNIADFLQDDEVEAWRLFIWMGSYGHTMPKPCEWYTNLPIELMGDLERPRPMNCQGGGYRTDGNWVTGTAQLTDSQVSIKNGQGHSNVVCNFPMGKFATYAHGYAKDDTILFVF